MNILLWVLQVLAALVRIVVVTLIVILLGGAYR